MSEVNKAIASGSRVTLRYRMVLEDGTVADESGDEPLEFTVGDGTLIAGLESMMTGMRAGESATLLVTPEQGFGYRDTDNVHPMPREDFPEELPLTRGTVIGFTSPSGEEVPGMVLEADDESVQIDFNHPLAGHTLQFEVEVLAVE
ncbi:FKBP-type peptidyl-prolyl cis-trans isomerase [Thiohalomonas denitrificans]|uniref:Peptidyl-prolyl cis-trans isomerase n=1 Tax=Thiohalomonas denitrificans TaxID=415747 RepID=A0A1G5PRG1_9GAMM|nr:peptidylprolyl isomerase [Thiohalomonas denitrificans]SCZ51629.1 FKBP-type peptidyl-prolyl cis-trans isomerase SlpA [Thiohalomonas denitrificans]